MLVSNINFQRARVGDTGRSGRFSWQQQLAGIAIAIERQLVWSQRHLIRTYSVLGDQLFLLLPLRIWMLMLLLLLLLLRWKRQWQRQWHRQRRLLLQNSRLVSPLSLVGGRGDRLHLSRRQLLTRLCRVCHCCLTCSHAVRILLRSGGHARLGFSREVELLFIPAALQDAHVVGKRGIPVVLVLAKPLLLAVDAALCRP
jgi:hypothetical protein